MNKQQVWGGTGGADQPQKPSRAGTQPIPRPPAAPLFHGNDLPAPDADAAHSAPIRPAGYPICFTHRLERLKTPAASSGAPLPALHPTAGAVPATTADTARSAHIIRTLHKQAGRIPAAPPACDTPLTPTPQGAGLRRRSADLRADPGMLSSWQAGRLAEAATAADATCRDLAMFEPS